MDRATWDWQRLLERRKKVLGVDVATAAANIGRPIYVRVRTWSGSGQPTSSETNTFSFSEGTWYERHRGPTSAEAIAVHLEMLNQLSDQWVEIYFEIDLDPSTAGGLTPDGVAGMLMGFAPLRRRLRP